MTFRSKKDETVTAYLDYEEPKYGTAMMIYLTGPNEGKSFSISKSTLKRWWTEIKNEAVKVEEPKKFEETIDFEKVNTTYAPNVTPHYIPKPQSVIDYENKKNKKFNSAIPEFEQIVNDLGEFTTKINENSFYVKFDDKSTLWRKKGCIDIYASEELFIKLSEAGLESSVNKDKDRPYAFKVLTTDDYNKVLEVFKND